MTLLKGQWEPLEGSDGAEPSDCHLAVRGEQVGSKGGHGVRADANAVVRDFSLGSKGKSPAGTLSPLEGVDVRRSGEDCLSSQIPRA